METLRRFRGKISRYWDSQPTKIISEAIKKEDSMIVPHYITLQLSSTKPRDIPSHVILKLGFCCENNNGKVVASNHVAQLFSCHKDRCKIYSKYLVKIPIGVI